MELDSRRLLVAVAALSLVAVCAFGQATQIIVMMNNNENAITATCVEIISLQENPVTNPSWHLNGASIGESTCLNTTGTLDTNRLLFTITPDCEGYLQCRAGFRSSLPKRVYAYPTHTAGRSITPETMPALLGTDEVLPCYLTVSAFRNFEACWFFASSTVNRKKINNSCTTGSDYSLRLPMVANSNKGMYQCEVTVTVTSGLQAVSPFLFVKAPIINLEVFEPVQLTGEIIASSLQDNMYQFSAPSVRGTAPYTYKWFINNIENTSTVSTLTIKLSNSLTTVMVSVSNHQDQTDTTFTVNRTAIVNAVMMCPTYSNVTLDTIVPTVLLPIFVVIGFLAIFILLFIVFYLYSKKCDLQKMLGEKNERQSSVSCDTTDGGDPITLCFTRIATDIKTHCPGSSTPTFYLTTIGDIMSRLSNSNHCDERFKKLVRDVRDRAHKLNDELDDEKHQNSDCGDGHVQSDSVPELEDAKAKFRHYLDMLDAIE